MKKHLPLTNNDILLNLVQLNIRQLESWRGTVTAIQKAHRDRPCFNKVDHITGFYVLLSYFMTLSVGPARSGLAPKSAKSVDYQTLQYGSTLRIRTALKVGAD